MDAIQFNTMPSLYWDDHVKISYIQRRIIVYSIMYYENDESCVPDSYYDSISHQLVQLQKDAGFDEFRKSTYYYAMYDFDGSTGFDIPSRLTKYDREYLGNIAAHVYRQWKNCTTFKERKEKLNNDKTKRLKQQKLQLQKVHKL